MKAIFGAFGIVVLLAGLGLNAHLSYQAQNKAEDAVLQTCNTEAKVPDFILSQSGGPRCQKDISDLEDEYPARKVVYDSGNQTYSAVSR